MSATIDLDGLSRLARKAETPPPWEATQWGYEEPFMVRHDSEEVIYLGSDVIAEFSKGYAEFIAAANPGVVLALIAELRALRNAVKDYDTNFPCDGGCNIDDGPAEECSRHGRSPRDLWERVERGYRAAQCIKNVDAALRADDRSSMRVVVAQEMITRFEQREER